MADIWDGGFGGAGIVKWELNTDKTAIRFSRTDGLAWGDDVPDVMTDIVIDGYKRAADETSRLAADITKIDPRFANVMTAQAQKYVTWSTTTPVAKRK